MTKKTYGWGTIIFFLPLLIFGTGKQLRFEQISIADGLSQSSVRCIFQDSMGFLWFGTTNGLNLYDGYKFTIYTHKPSEPFSISHGNISAIVEDKNGTLWIGTLGNGLNRFDRESERFTHFALQRNNKNPPDSESIFSLYVDHSGVLWAGVYGGGLNRYNEKEGTFTRFIPKPGKSYLRANTISCILEDQAGNLLVGTYSGLLKFDGKSETFTGWKNPAVAEMLNTLETYAILVDSTGTLWVASGGLYRIKPDRQRIDYFPLKNSYPGLPESCLIFALHEDRNGDLWIGTTDWGIFIFDRESGEFSQHVHDAGNPDSLRKNYIYSIMEDRAGIIWIGTEGGGVNKYDRFKEKFVHHRSDPESKNSLNHNSVYALREDHKGNLWIGTNGGGISRLNKRTGVYTHYLHQENDPGSLAHNYINCIHEDHSGTIWVGTYGLGLDKFDAKTERFTHYRFKNKDETQALNAGVVTSIGEDKNGYLWIGTQENGLNRMDPKTETFLRFSHDPAAAGSISQNFITFVFRDSRGILWAGTRNKGLNRLIDQAKNHFEHYVFTAGAPSLNHNGMKCIHEGRDGILWIGTNGGGLNRYDPGNGSFAAFTSKDGLADDVVYGILEDKTGNLWLSTNRGISRFSPGTKVFKNYTPRDGLQGYEFNTGAYHKNKYGEMYFGGFNGFNSFVPEHIDDNSFVPPVAITGFFIFNRPVETGKDSPLPKHITKTAEIVLSYRDNIFSFEFAALDYTDPTKNRYQYKVEGLSENWIYLGTKNDITFTDMDPGSYTLKIRGSNNDAIWNNKGTSIKIIIEPPFWRTWWFQSLLVLCIAAAAFAWHKSRMDKLSLRLKTEAEMQNIFIRYNISKREQEIIHLMLKGKSNKDLEDELFISMKTVKSHVYNIYQKLGVKNRLELIYLIQKSIDGK